MAVTSGLTSIVDFNTTPTYVGYGGGAGAGDNTDIIIEGIQSGGRRVDNAADKGFGVSFTNVDLSAANQHIKVWTFVTQWSSVTQVQVRISSGADDDHELPTTEYPSLGGFIPIWVDVSRAPEVGGSANEASIGEIGVLLDIGNVGGNAENLILDEIHYGIDGLTWDGTGGDFDDFRTFESTNNEGNVVTLNGVDFVYSRLTIGSATATTFTDSGFTLIYPNQSLVSDTFMGLTIDLQNASTDVNLSNATIQSSSPSTATKRPDLIVTGTSGVLDLDSVNIIGTRTIDLTSAVTITNSLLETLNLTQSNSIIQDSTIRSNTATGVAMLNDANFSNLSGVTFLQAGSGHAIEITTPGSYGFDNLTFTGYGADGTNGAAVYNNSGGSITINVLNGGGSPTVRNGTGASTTINNSVAVKVTVLDAVTLNPIQNARVLLEADTGGDLSVGTDILTGLTDVNGVLEDTGFNYTNLQPVTGKVRKATSSPYYKQSLITGTINSSGFDLNILLILDE